MNHLFRERFQGHEAPVDPATWQVIEARLLTSAPPADSVNELFRERFADHQVDVNPAIWKGISSQLGHGAAAGGGLFGGFGWIAAGLAGVAAVGALVWALHEPAEQQVSLGLAEAEHQIHAPARTSAIPETSVMPAAATEKEHPTSPVFTESTSRPEIRTPASVSAGTASDADSPGAIMPAPRDSNPELVEGIISNLAEQVQREVLENHRHDMPRDPGVTVNDQQTTTPTEPVAPKLEVAPLEEVKLFMPNVFTPNGDVQNETYRIEPKTGWLRTLVRVYSMKTNQLVFSTNSLADEWTGANCEDGYYLVAVELTTMDERVVSKGQVVWLNRSIMN